MQDSYQDRVQEIRYQFIDRKKRRKADMFMAQWLNFKIAITQNRSARTIKKQEAELNHFFNQPEFKKMFEEDAKRTEAAIFSEIKDSAQLYQKSCSEDSHYTSKLFGLMKMKNDEIANKAGMEVYEMMIQTLMEMADCFWRNQMIAALHLAYQDVFGQEAIKAELFFDNPIIYEKFEKIMDKVLDVEEN